MIDYVQETQPAEGQLRVGHTWYIPSAKRLRAVVQINPLIFDDVTGGFGPEGSEGGDTRPAASAGSDDLNDPKYLYGRMGNLLGGGLDKTANICGGVIGKYTLKETNASKYPKAGVVGEVGAGTSADYCFQAVISDGDNPPKAVKAIALFGPGWNATKSYGSELQYGLDLEGPALYGTHTLKGYKKADIRLGGQIDGTDAGDDVVILRKAGAPTDGTSGTGAGNAGPGSFLVDTTNKDFYINANTKASPTWKKITRAA